MYGVCLVSPARKEGRCSGIPAGYSLTHSLYPCCMPRQRNCVDMPLLTSRQGSCPKKKTKQTVHEITPISHGETEADARKRKARTRPGRSRKQDCLLASLALATKSNGRVHVRGERSLPNHRRAKSRDFLWCVHKKRIFVFESGMVGICMEAWKKDARTPEALPRISITGRRPQEQKEADRVCIPYLHFDVTK